MSRALVHLLRRPVSTVYREFKRPKLTQGKPEEG